MVFGVAYAIVGGIKCVREFA